MRILIIEDETALRERVIAQLREQGYAVDSAAETVPPSVRREAVGTKEKSSPVRKERRNFEMKK
jgi:DNA-binding response OmpR family regulator